MRIAWDDGKTAAKISIIVFIVLLLISYVFFQSRNLIEGPQITLTSPQTGSVLSDPCVIITGNVKNVSFLTLNDRHIYTNEDGFFNEELLLSPGYNVWTISAKDKFGKNIVKKIELVFKKT